MAGPQAPKGVPPPPLARTESRVTELHDHLDVVRRPLERLCEVLRPLTPRHQPRQPVAIGARQHLLEPVAVLDPGQRRLQRQSHVAPAEREAFGRRGRWHVVTREDPVWRRAFRRCVAATARAARDDQFQHAAGAIEQRSRLALDARLIRQRKAEHLRAALQPAPMLLRQFGRQSPERFLPAQSAGARRRAAA